jgi:hypothetical protein
MIPSVGSHFLSRENTNAAVGASFHLNITDLNVRNGLVIGNTIDQIGLDGTAGLIENVAFINNIASSGSATRMFHLNIAGSHPAYIIRNILMIDEPDEIKFGIDLGVADDIDNVTVDKVAFYSFNQTSAIAFKDGLGGGVGLARGSSMCFFDNAADTNTNTNFPADSIRGIPPGFVSPERSRYDVLPGTAWHAQGCGVKPTVPVGVCKMNRTLGWSNLEPECMTDFHLGGGGGRGTFVPTPFGHP